MTTTGQETAEKAEGATEASASSAPASGFPDEGPVADLVETMEMLETVLARETELLATNDAAEMYEVQKRKTQLAAAYETRVAGLTDDPGPIQELDDATREELRTRMTSFVATVRSNARAVNAARAITQDLLQKTVEIVKKHRRETSGYAANGARRDETERHSAPISINKSL